jgi:hypothetical protein
MYPTLNIDENKPVICNYRKCERFSDGKWSEYSKPLKISREASESWFSKEGLIFIGGNYGLNTNEIIPNGGGTSEWGFYNIMSGFQICKYRKVL